ncbi:MAG TPA: T9SS type B sorting domain-containing protein [Flavobacteriales bacterium]|nr:T9SS type B sorting domain-containing protein [Flavobacteriales bacterium]
MNKLFFIIILFSAVFNNIFAQCTQLDAGDDIMVDCSNNCTTLKADLFSSMGAQTDTYTITKATPCPLPTYTTTPTNLHIDDQWSGVIQLPFTFYFFGQAYDRLILSSNGVVSFDINRIAPLNQQPNSYSDWQFSDQLPSTNMFRNAIFGAYHDLNPEATQADVIKYFISGTYPQRKFVLSFENVPHFSCENLTTTQKIILYETSNVIDVQIDHKDLCAGWNDGNAVVGIQNEQGTVAYVPPGRNTGQWTVPASDPELWRFVPNHNVPNINYDFKWYNNETNDLVGTGQSINVCVTENTTYRVEANFDDPNTGQHYTLTDIVTVFLNKILGTPDLGTDINECDQSSVRLDGTTLNATSYQWQKDGIDFPGETNPELTVTQSGVYTITAYNGVCSSSDEVVVNIEPRPIVDLGPDLTSCAGNIVTLTPSLSNHTGNESFQWQKDGVDIPGETQPTLNVTKSGKYSVIVYNTIGCKASDDIQVFFDPALNLGPDQTVCYGNVANISSNILNADTYQWLVNGIPSSNTSDELTLSIPGDYEVTLNLTKGACNTSDNIHIKILEPVSVVATPVLYGELLIEASGGLPPYQYSVDGINFQNSNHFTNLPNGDYHISIKDSNNCEYPDIASVHVVNLISPQFFTPNGDGYNDYWRIENAENTPDADLYIYDRYGKLMKHMKSTINDTWDGTLNNVPVFGSDYWYVLVLPNGKTYKGHFALKR